MEYKTYETDVVNKYHVKLIGWPHDEWANPSDLKGGLPVLEKISGAITNKTCKFVRLDREEVEERKRRIIMGEILTPDRDGNGASSDSPASNTHMSNVPASSAPPLLNLPAPGTHASNMPASSTRTSNNAPPGARAPNVSPSSAPPSTVPPSTVPPSTVPPSTVPPSTTPPSGAPAPNMLSSAPASTMLPSGASASTAPASPSSAPPMPASTMPSSPSSTPPAPASTTPAPSSSMPPHMVMAPPSTTPTSTTSESDSNVPAFGVPSRAAVDPLTAPNTSSAVATAQPSSAPSPMQDGASPRANNSRKRSAGDVDLDAPAGKRKRKPSAKAARAAEQQPLRARQGKVKNTALSKRVSKKQPKSAAVVQSDNESATPATT
ncbi:hypothetical protein BJ138DRAFT_1201465 [Hygrophoropsis aurantiaca]|uniref:Uncharacterized protein n=1 Tax=Hygrophoropsis aurantiaca TaxID=72124 RepID=A0ACB7ZNI2_9AGAM|nr:hypothetical protein BJ138DRAFT_1201465 [Hygrophoropsis aurantiaca]